MKRLDLRSGILASITGLAAIISSAYAEQPPDVVASDGHANTASGSRALLNLDATSSIATSNSAFGTRSLEHNSTGADNTAAGCSALNAHTANIYNVAIGSFSLFSDSTGGANTALGAYSLYFNGGYNNTASGYEALVNTTTGANNTAFGSDALYSNTAGKGNEAQGVNALFNNDSGIRNLGIGSNALYDNVSGSYNVALGFNAGDNQTTGNDNIYIANPGVAEESQALRLGAQGTAGVQGSGILSAFIAGVATSQVTGSAVYITPSGQLGVLASAERFKTDVETMGAASERLAQLRPVTFKLKTDPKGTLQYGLIAEEVAKVYPELVIHGADGRIDGVRYEELAPLLLNGVQQQQARLIAQARKADAEAQVIHELEAQADQADAQARIIHGLEAQIASLDAFKQSMLSVLRETQSREQFARAP